MTLIAIVTLIITPSISSIVSAVPPPPTSRTQNDAPPLAGVTAPAGTKLANMDITVTPRPREESAIYELRSPLNATVFKDQYALNAKRAGYQVAIKSGLVVGVRKDGTAIRLRVIEADRGSTAILTVKPPANDRT